MWTDDPVTDAWRRDMEFERWLDKRPKCDCCGEPIQDEEAYYIGGEWICEQCIEEYYKFPIPDED